MEKKKMLIDTIILDEDSRGHVTVKREKQWSELEFYATGRDRELCNLCKFGDYPDCRKDCFQHQMWRKRTGATL